MAAPVTGSVLSINDSDKVPILNCFGTNGIGCSDSETRETDIVWQDYVFPLGFNTIQQAAGSAAARQHVWYPGDTRPLTQDGYNLLRSELDLRGDDPAKVLKGSINKHYGRDLAYDYARYAPFVTKNGAVVMNLLAPLIGKHQPIDWASLDVSVVDAETDRMVQLLAEGGLPCKWIQFCDELMIGEYDQEFSNVNNYAELCNKFISRYHAKYPGTALCGCTYPADRMTKNDWIDMVKILDFDWLSQHLQFGADRNTIDMCLERINVDLPLMCDNFEVTYPGKGLALTQTLNINEERTTNVFIDKVGEGLIQWALGMKIIRMNVERNNLIKMWICASLESHIGTHADVIHPLYHFTNLGSGMFSNNDYINTTFLNTPGSENLISIGVKKTASSPNPNEVRVWVINPTDAPITVDQIHVNGRAKKGKIESVSGTPFSAVVTIPPAALKSASARFEAYSMTRVSLPQIK